MPCIGLRNWRNAVAPRVSYRKGRAVKAMWTFRINGGMAENSANESSMPIRWACVRRGLQRRLR